MNPLALSLLGLQGAAGTLEPAPTGKLPPVHSKIFGVNLISVAKIDRSALRALRCDSEVSYLLDHGPLTTAELAHAFGLSNEAMFKDLRLLETATRIRRVGNPKFPRWEAA